MKMNSAECNKFEVSMAIKIKNVWAEICSFENLHKAYLNARKNKRFRAEVLEFTNNLEDNLFQLRNELLNQTYKAGEYRQFFVYDPKKRLIMALPFRDRVVQWAVYQVVNPYFAKGYITDSYACIDGRGAHQAVQRLHYWLRLICNKSKPDEKWYYQKIDFSKYFYRVSHQVLLETLSKKIKDEKLMWYFKKTIDCETTPFGLPLGKSADEVLPEERLFDVGMPIGSLISQMLANVNLDALDQYCKRELGIRYYIRYMDDIIILHNDKKELHEIKNKVETFANEKLKLTLNDKTVLRPITLGIEFVGYKVWNTHIKIRKSTSLRMKRRLNSLYKKCAKGEISLEKVNKTIVSYKGMLKYCNSHNLRSSLNQTYLSYGLLEKEQKEK